MTSMHSLTGQDPGPLTPGGRELSFEIEQWYYAEADCLDRRDFEAWLTLLHPQIEYRVPLMRNLQRNRLTHELTRAGEAAWFDEGLRTLQQRVEQLQTGMHWAEEPASRTAHLVSNVRVWTAEPVDGTPAALVQSHFIVYQNRQETETALFAGRREDLLLQSPQGWRIRRRTVLLNQNVLLAKALTTFF